MIAYSGGIDSHVLLHACYTIIKNHSLKLKLRAVHVDHQMQSAAAAFSVHCKKVCRELEIPCSVLQVQSAPQPGQSREAWAREARYDLLASNVKVDETVLTAQTEDDQAETLLLQLMRGAGLKGLSAMGKTKALGISTLSRPLLGCSRADIEAYARDNQLHWIEDPSNNNTDYLRNFVRRDIIPKLREKVPGVSQAMARSALHIATAQRIIEHAHQPHFDRALCKQTHRLDQSVLLGLDSDSQAVVMRQWLDCVGAPQLSQAKLGTWQEQLQAKDDKSPLIQNGTVALRRYKNYWYAVTQAKPSPAVDSTEILWTGQSELILPFGGRLYFEPKLGMGLSKQVALQVRFQDGMLRCKPEGIPFSKSLKKWWQHYEIPPWLRRSWPLIFKEDSLIMVPSLFVCEGNGVLPDQEGIWIHYEN